jgi:protein ECT2
MKMRKSTSYAQRLYLQCSAKPVCVRRVYIDQGSSNILVHQFGLFSFKTGAISRPSTPTTSTRSRAAVFGLDVISRTLSRSALSSEVFSFGVNGTVSGTKRSKGGMSRSSTQTMSTALTESTNRFSYRSNSTAATSLMTTEDESMHGKSPRKLLKRGKSPGPSSDGEPRKSTESLARPEVQEEEEEVEDILNDEPQQSVFGESERDLARQLELAKQNSLSLQGTGLETASFMLRDPPFADTIYEGKYFVVCKPMQLMPI